MKEPPELYELDVVAIQQYQCNRSPMLFVDRISHVKPGEFAIGYKNFTFNEWFFPEHYPDDPNVPGFVLVEAMVQVFLMTFLTFPEHKGERTNFVKINDVSFRSKVTPGDRLEIDARLTKFKRGIAHGQVEGRIKEDIACEGNFTVAVPTILNKFKPRPLSK